MTYMIAYKHIGFVDRDNNKIEVHESCNEDTFTEDLKRIMSLDEIEVITIRPHYQDDKIFKGMLDTIKDLRFEIDRLKESLVKRVK